MGLQDLHEVARGLIHDVPPFVAHGFDALIRRREAGGCDAERNAVDLAELVARYLAAVVLNLCAEDREHAVLQCDPRRWIDREVLLFKRIRDQGLPRKRPLPFGMDAGTLVDLTRPIVRVRNDLCHGRIPEGSAVEPLVKLLQGVGGLLRAPLLHVGGIASCRNGRCRMAVERLSGLGAGVSYDVDIDRGALPQWPAAYLVLEDRLLPLHPWVAPVHTLVPGSATIWEDAPRLGLWAPRPEDGRKGWTSDRWHVRDLLAEPARPSSQGTALDTAPADLCGPVEIPESLRSLSRQGLDEQARRVLEAAGWDLEDMEVLGRGSFGTVVKARWKDDRSPWAVKVLHRRTYLLPEDRRRAERECALLSGEMCPGIVRFGPEERRCFDERNVTWFAMEVVAGEGGRTLAAWLADGQREGGEREHIVLRLVEAVEWIHRRGIVHRDIRPQNIKFRERSSEDAPQPVLLDFGWARPWPGGGETMIGRSTLGALGFGEPPFAAPEQLARGRESVRTPQVDVHALAWTAAAVLLGRTPTSLRELESRHRWSTVLARAGAEAPAERYCDARELRRALEGEQESRSFRPGARLPGGGLLLGRTHWAGDAALVAWAPAPDDATESWALLLAGDSRTPEDAERAWQVASSSGRGGVARLRRLLRLGPGAGDGLVALVDAPSHDALPLDEWVETKGAATPRSAARLIASLERIALSLHHAAEHGQRVAARAGDIAVLGNGSAHLVAVRAEGEAQRIFDLATAHIARAVADREDDIESAGPFEELGDGETASRAWERKMDSLVHVAMTDLATLARAFDGAAVELPPGYERRLEALEAAVASWAGEDTSEIDEEEARAHDEDEDRRRAEHEQGQEEARGRFEREEEGRLADWQARHDEALHRHEEEEQEARRERKAESGQLHSPREFEFEPWNPRVFKPAVFEPHEFQTSFKTPYLRWTLRECPTALSVGEEAVNRPLAGVDPIAVAEREARGIENGRDDAWARKERLEQLLHVAWFLLSVGWERAGRRPGEVAAELKAIRCAPWRPWAMVEELARRPVGDASPWDAQAWERLAPAVADVSTKLGQHAEPLDGNEGDANAVVRTLARALRDATGGWVLRAGPRRKDGRKPLRLVRLSDGESCQPSSRFCWYRSEDVPVWCLGLSPDGTHLLFGNPPWVSPAPDVPASDQ